MQKSLAMIICIYVPSTSASMKNLVLSISVRAITLGRKSRGYIQLSCEKIQETNINWSIADFHWNFYTSKKGYL